MPIIVDHQLLDGYSVGGFSVIHTDKREEIVRNKSKR